MLKSTYFNGRFFVLDDDPSGPNGWHAIVKLKDINLVKDGNAWMATRKDFVNLQESNAGFGDTQEDAVADLVRMEREEESGRPAAVKPSFLARLWGWGP